MQHYIVYSHGFGVDKTDRGLFSDIAAAIPEYEHILFDYNEVDKATNTLTVSPFQEQVRRLKDQLKGLDDGEDKIIDIVAHSQGCVIAALAQSPHVRKVVCLAPPEDLDVEKIANRFRKPGSTVDLQAVSRIVHRDGSTTIVPEGYWTEIKQLDVAAAYSQLAGLAQVTFIVAKDDDVLGPTNFDTLRGSIDVERVSGDHNFRAGARPEICDRVARLLSS